jgi:hypothetical protein
MDVQELRTDANVSVLREDAQTLQDAGSGSQLTQNAANPRLSVRSLPEDIRTFLTRALQCQSNSIADIRSNARRMRKSTVLIPSDAPVCEVSTEYVILPNRAMIHFLNVHGYEVDYQGMATESGNHEYRCAVHRSVQLKDAAFALDKSQHLLRQHGGKEYYCERCDVAASQ